MSTLQRLGLGLSIAIAIGLVGAACFEAYVARQDTQWLHTVFLGEILEKTEKRLSRLAADPNALPLSEEERLAEQLEVMALATARLSGFDTTMYSKRSGPYRILKAPPADAARIGGQCGNLTRLFTTTARLAGLEARRAHLFEVKGRRRPGRPVETYVHSIVEVNSGDRWVIVDPLYGVVYRNAAGDLATSAELAAQPQLVKINVENRAIPDDYMHFPPSEYNFEFFHFEELRRIRWTILPGGERIRSLIASVIGEDGANHIAYPHSFERPHIFLARLYGFGSLIMAAVSVFIYRRRRL